MQAPHPEHFSGSMRSSPKPPTRSSKVMAVSSQASPQLRQETPCVRKQSGPMRATRSQGRVTVGAKTGSLHASAQAPQKVQAPFLKSMMGVLAGPANSIPSGQAVIHAPQDVQASRIPASVVQGGLGALFLHAPSGSRRVCGPGSSGWCKRRPAPPRKISRVLVPCDIHFVSGPERRRIRTGSTSVAANVPFVPGTSVGWQSRRCP